MTFSLGQPYPLILIALKVFGLPLFIGPTLRTKLLVTLTNDELFGCLQAIWNVLSEETVTTVTKPMQSRALAIFSNDGGHTKY